MDKNQRKVTWVLSKFQRWFVFSFVAYSTMFITILTFGMTSWFSLVARRYIDMAGVLSPTFLQQLHHSMQTGLYLLAGLIVTNFAASLFFAIQFSRKVAGPVYAAIRNLQNYSKTGEWQPIQLRDGDCFEELASEINLALDSNSSQKEHSEAA